MICTSVFDKEESAGNCWNQANIPVILNHINENGPLGGHLYLVDHGSTDCGSRITWFHYFNTVRHILSIFAYHNKHIYLYVCLSVLYLWYTTAYKYIFTSWARSIFTPILLPWISNVVVIDVFITTPTRQTSVLKAWKYYGHTASHSVSHSPASV